MAEALRTHNLRKTYPGVLAVDDVNLHVDAGEIVGLIGENGAGKTTLVRMLAGLERPDKGLITVRGHPRNIDGPSDARQLGIGIVLQHFSLVATLTGLENLMLADRAAAPRGILRPLEVRERLNELHADYGFAVDLDRRVGALSVGEQQRLEILKCLRDDPELIILDEPTAVLDISEISALLRLVRIWAAAGKTIILISHKLDELLEVTDRIVVMRRGRLVADRATSDMTPATIAGLMVGDEGDESAVGSEERLQQGQASRNRSGADSPALRVSNLSANATAAGRSIHDLDLCVPPGRVVGIAGIEGNGQRTLVEALLGLARPTSGEIELLGQSVTQWSPQQRLSAGLSVIHEDRRAVAGVGQLDVLENLVLRRIVLGRDKRFGLIRWKALRRRCASLAKEYGVRAQLDARYATLSGGNQQRVVLARELSERPAVLVAAQPTRGLDIHGVQYVLGQLDNLRQQGCAIVLISSELEDLLELADEVFVIRRGRFVGSLSREAVSKSEIASLMVGAGAY